MSVNVSLTAELESWVQHKVESGSYTSASEVLREAIRALRDREELRSALLVDLRRDLADGARQLDAGLGVPVDEDGIAAIKAAGRRRLKSP